MSRVSAALLVCISICLAADRSSITQAELVRRAQELFDAVAPGNQTPWKRYVADDAMFFDEKGRAMDKYALLDDLKPLPVGYSGSIRVVRAASRFATNVAVMSYDLE